MESNLPDLNNQPVPVGQENQKAPGPKNFKALITLVIIFGAIILFAGGYFALAYFQNIWPFANPAPSPVVTESPSYFPSPSETPSNYPTSSETQSPSPSASATSYPMEVKWNDKLIKDNTKCGNLGENPDRQIYVAGEILTGDFKGEALCLVADVTMGGYDFSYHTSDGGQISLDNIINFPKPPETIVFPNSHYELEKGYISELFSDVGTTTKIFYNDILGDAYLTEDGCIVFELPDHTALAYDFNFPFIGESGLLDLKFNDGQQNKEEYFYIRRSCGGLCTYYQTVSEKTLQPESRLTLAGKMATGEEFYEIKDQNDSYLQELYNDKNTAAYYNEIDYSQLQKNKYTYQQFISYHPYLYWKDPLGDWIEFENKRFDVMAEMCKPVIYLYPESKTNLNVFISPNGGLKNTQPPYQNGWQIQVEPDGTIMDLKTGLKYGSLLWEGWGLGYPEIKEGWVVKKTDADSFLSEKLSYLGLNKKEIGEFKDYWIPKLSDKPYYEISFLNKVEFDALSPLNISPLQPKTLIRVMMTAKGLDKKIELPEQKLIKAPQRVGFTVVEWGGALLK